MNPIETVNRLIAARKPGTLTLTQAAKACRLSPCRLSTLYREITGTTFKSACARRQLDHAMRLIALGWRYPRIARACGFSSTPHFHARFKDLAGVTAGEWRRRLDTAVAETRVRWDASAASFAALKPTNYPNTQSRSKAAPRHSNGRGNTNTAPHP